MVTKKAAILIINLLLFFFDGMAFSDNNQYLGQISNKNQLCWYKSENGKLLKTCETKLEKNLTLQKFNKLNDDEKPKQTLITKASNPSLSQAPIVPLSSRTEKSLGLGLNIKPTNTNVSKESSLFYGFIALIIGYFWGSRKKKKGEEYMQDEAEQRVKNELRKLDKNRFCILHDITLPIEDGTTQIDHIVVSESGIFVIETKSHKGWIFGKENDSKWTQSIKGGKKYLFHNPVIQNANHIKHIQKITNIENKYINNIVVFANPEMELRTPLPQTVMKLSELTRHISNAPSVSLNKQKLYEFLGCIEFNRKERSMQTNQEHIAFVKERYRL